ncbi:hypothetical protein BC567DRAFT_17254 [Phyllosticta citribraziliensis]
MATTAHISKDFPAFSLAFRSTSPPAIQLFPKCHPSHDAEQSQTPRAMQPKTKSIKWYIIAATRHSPPCTRAIDASHRPAWYQKGQKRKRKEVGEKCSVLVRVVVTPSPRRSVCDAVSHHVARACEGRKVDRGGECKGGGRKGICPDWKRNAAPCNATPCSYVMRKRL